MFKRNFRKITWLTADDPLEDRTTFQYGEPDIARLHQALCGLAEFADRTDAASVSNVLVHHTNKGDIFMGDVDYIDENGRHVAYTLNCVIGATHRDLQIGREEE